MSKSMQVSQKRMPQLVEKMEQVTAKLIEEMEDEVERQRGQGQQKPVQTGI